jgi:signal transduction histidine kinase
MRLRTKLLGGILLTLLAQIAVTGTFTLVSFLSTTHSSREAGLRADWDRARAFVEELRHRLSMDMYQLAFILKQEGDGAAATAVATPETPAIDGSAPLSPAVTRLQETVRYFISLTGADRIVVQDDPGGIVVDEKAGVSGAGTDLPIARLNPADFQFPRSEFVPVKYGDGTTRLFLVTGTTFPSGGGSRRLYMVTDIDKGMAESIWEKTGTEVAFFVGATPVAAASAWESFETESPPRSRIVRLGADPFSVFSQTLAADPPARINMAAVRSLLAERLYVRSVLFSYLTAFLVTLAGSLFVAAGITSLVVSPFSRLSAWLHRYMDTGEVHAVQIRTSDETGFLAGAFHGMVSTLIEEKRVIGEQLEQIRFLHAWNERIVDGIRAGIVVTDSHGDVEFCNSYFAGLVGRTPAALRGMPLRALVEGTFDLRGESAEAVFSAEGGRDGVLEELTLRRDGEPEQHFTAKVSGIALAGSRQGSLVVLEDVSASEHLWERMTIADRITSLGILSAGMAHEINNPLGSILSHVSWLKAVETEKDKLHSLTWIESETNRIAALIRRIRAWSAPAAGPDGADLNAVCAETLEVLRFTLEKRGLVLSLDLCRDLPPVACSADELKQVVLNILLNAEQACADGGSITVRTRVEAAGMVALWVADDGPGIAAEHVHRVFDPFFTTKGSSNGNGLGLSICYAIVKRAGGEIRVASTPGRGTEVEVMLRVHERPDSG